MRFLHTQLLATLFFVSVASSRETVYDAAKIARNLIENSRNSVGSMATTFPLDDPHFPAMPFSLPEYYASCHRNGSLTLLFLPISRNSRNILQSVDHAASISITSPEPLAARPRVALIGNITIFKKIGDIPDAPRIQRCYLAKHPDARWWLPDDSEAAHLAYWARFDPHTIYFVGGFGDHHYIGFIPLQLYQAAIPDETTVAFDQGDDHILQQQAP